MFPAIAACIVFLTGCSSKSASDAPSKRQSADEAGPTVIKTDKATYVLPAVATIESGQYQPLSRPLFLYVNRASLTKPQVAAYLQYYLNEGQELLPQVGFIRPAQAQQKASLESLTQALGDFRPPAKVAGTVTMDGSSTVFPISQAVAEEFQLRNRAVRVVVGTSGTGGGFKRFVVGEVDINNASRPIAPKEIEQCRHNGVEYLELVVAVDGVSVVVNRDNDWCVGLSVEQLRAIWEPNSRIKRWSDIDPAWPQREITLYGPGPDSGTFDYFTEVIVGTPRKSRVDYTPSEDDNILVRGVAGDRYSLGYFGFAYYSENKDKVKALGIAPAATKP
jgi:phosphate binding protein